MIAPMDTTTRQFTIDAEQYEILNRWLRAHNTPQRVVFRCNIVLNYAKGLTQQQVADKLSTTRTTVRLWCSRFADQGPEGLTKIAPGRGRKPTISDTKIDQIVEATLHTTPPGETHWSCRTMAEAQGVSKATIQRIWSARGIKPHLVRTFKLSNDPDFEAKLIDVVGLYLDPPDNAVVLCVDEKSQIQALDRTQPSLPMKTGRAGTMTHDDKRNGTTTLFAALDTITGAVIGQCLPRHRHQEFLTFLKTLDKEHPKDLDLHLIVDNYRTHKHDNVNKWLEKHPRFHLHFIPTSSSWLNLVERWFGKLTDKAIRRGVHTSVKELEQSILDYLTTHNEDPQPFVWTAPIDQILEKVRRGRVKLETLH